MNLVIGKTSQLAQYFPLDYIKISSRDIPHSIFDQEWDRVFVCFAEQKTYNIKDSSFDDVNYRYTRSIIEKLKANKIVFYSTAELWNNTCGPVNLNTPYNYHKTDYVSSKEKITEFIKQNYANVVVAYPFNFNSVYRLPPFLFGKIFDSIVNKKCIEIGDTYYYRELLHPSFVVNETLYLNEHKLIGCGNLTFINSLIRKLYSAFDMQYENYIIENIKEPSVYRKNIFYKEVRCEYNELNLLDSLIKELYDKFSNKIS